MRIAFIAATGLALAACSEATVRPDATADAGANADAAESPDTGPFDALPAYDASISGMIPGSAFEGLELRWTAPLELCTRWSGNDLARNKADKVHLTIAPAPQARLDPSALVLDGKLRESPFEADQRRFQGVRGTLFELDVRVETLTAALAHELGAGRRLITRLSLVRSAGSRDPIVASELREISFALERPGTPRDIDLELCDAGSLDWEREVRVISAQRQGQTLVIVREERAQQIVGGTYPLTVRRTEVVTSAEAHLTLVAQGFWANTYGASQHGWRERSEIDFTRDLALHEAVFAPAPGGDRVFLEEIIERVELLDLNAPGDDLGVIRVHRRNLMTSATRTEDWTPDGRWVPVTPEDLRARASGRCAQPDVTGLSVQSGAVFQLVTCPGNGPLGFSLEMVVPVAAAFPGVKAGEPIDKAQITAATYEGRPALRVPLGPTWTMTLARFGASANELIAELREQGGMFPSSALVTLAPLAEPAPRDSTLVQRSADRAVESTLVRRWAWQGDGETAIHAPVSFSLRFGGATHVVEAWDSLSYANTHHNWNDRLRARAGDLELRWSVTYGIDDGMLRHTVSAVRLSDGATVLPDTEVQ